MLQSQGLLHDTYVYGVDAKKTLPTILSPTEIMDGAIVSGNCVSACDKNPTYVHENNPVVHDLFEEHGKTLNFVCQIITNENVYLADKERSSDWTAKLCKMLDLDGVIVSQEGFGNPDTDLIMNCKKIEAEGIKTVIIPKENEKDLEEIPENVKTGMKIIPVSDVKEVIKIALKGKVKPLEEICRCEPVPKSCEQVSVPN